MSAINDEGSRTAASTAKPFTADDARKLAGPSIDDRVEAALAVIKQAAVAKRRTVALHDPFWTNCGYSKTDDWKAASQQLTDLGFDVTFFYEERQFVDMYTLVRW